jgi:KDO2-lipid IV(A) lauroyltransferase
VRDIAQRLVGLLLRAIACAARALPERLMGPLTRALGVVAFDLVRYRRPEILSNLGLAFPALDRPARTRLGREVSAHLVRTLLEFLRIPRYREEGLSRRVRIDGLEHLRAAHAAGRGALILSGHLGSFELAVAAAAREVPIAVVVKRFPPAVDAFVRAIREGSGLTVLPADGGARPILRALRDNKVVVFVLDQNAPRRIGVFVDFFGVPASTMRGLATLALASGAPVIPAFAHRTDSGDHVLAIDPPLELARGPDRDATVLAHTARFTALVEAAIRRHPPQWFWSHRRYRTRPRP